MVREVYGDATDFSGGEKQKLLFARALYRKAPLLILDEPTAALDPIAEHELYLRYGEAARGRTVIFIPPAVQHAVLRPDCAAGGSGNRRGWHP